MVVAYTYLIWIVLVLFVAAGGWLGWWQGTEALYRRELGAEVFSDASMSPGVFVRRQLRRAIWTTGGAAGGALLGIAALIALSRFQS